LKIRYSAPDWYWICTMALLLLVLESTSPTITVCFTAGTRTTAIVAVRLFIDPSLDQKKALDFSRSSVRGYVLPVMVALLQGVTNSTARGLLPLVTKKYVEW
jgi:hypothetical protein